MSYRILRVVVLLTVAILPIRVSTVAADSASLPAITAIAAGGGHTCALTSGGGAKCWGSNEYGQLGNGTTTDSLTPVDVTGLEGGVSAIAAGDGHTCALTIEGGVKCWGDNYSRQLGNGTTTDSLTPVDVTGLAGGVSAIAAGDGHACALAIVGGVTCWGANYVAGAYIVASGVSAIAAGGDHACALTSGGRVKCWGHNVFGQLGNGTTTNYFTDSPLDVSGLASGVGAIAVGGQNSCALTIGGGVKCWGNNGAGQLGDGSTTDSSVPVDVSGLASGVAAIDAGGHACAVTSTGGVRCWGWNEDGQLGNGTTTKSTVPVDVSGLASGIEAVAVGGGYTCALTRGGGVKCWGRIDFASEEAPRTDVADPGLPARPADFPLLPLLAGLGAGIAMLIRPRARQADAH